MLKRVRRRLWDRDVDHPYRCQFDGLAAGVKRDPRLDAVSETAWYLAASPNQIDTLEYAYLEGEQCAYNETCNGFDVAGAGAGAEIKCRLDFGAKAIDLHGLYRNPGA